MTKKSSAVYLAALLFVLPALAQAKSSGLWSERDSSSPALAQIPDFAALADKLVPAVVSLQVEQKVEMSRGPSGMDPYEFFFRQFGGEVPREYHNRGLGSGFFITSDGLILTNQHVVENAEHIEVTYLTKEGSERRVAGKVLGSAPEYDVALVQADDIKGAPIAYLGDSDQVRIGEWVMAVGNPFGLAHSVSVGIISAKERRDIMPSGRRGLYDFLQTDASINPGNSGGPLINTRGEVIGINSAINAAGSGIGFAIPINMVKTMLPDLKSKGRYARSWIGIKIQPLNADLAQSYGLKRATGALVAEVVPDGPAAKSGLQEGDVILEFDGKAVRDSSDLPLYASMAGVGKRVNLKIWRSGKEKSVGLTLAAFPDDEQQLASSGKSGESSGLGIVVADITPELQRHFDLDTAHGVVIKNVEPGSPAARHGIRPGDVLLSLNGQAIKRARQFAEAVSKLKSGEVMRMQVLRQGGRVFLAMRKP